VEDSELLVEPLHSHKAKFVDDLRQSVSSLVEHLYKRSSSTTCTG